MKRPASAAYLEEFRKYVIMEPYPFVLDLKKSKGMWLTTVDGDRIFDWAGFYGSKLIGLNHPRMFEKDYLDRLITAANNRIANPDFLTPECVAYYRKLREYAPRCMLNPHLEIYAVNSGAEAVENLSKYFINLYDAKCAERKIPVRTRRMIYFDQAFHGRTIFTLNITQLSDSPVITKDFRGMVMGNIRVPFPAQDSSRSEHENDEITEKCLGHIRNVLLEYGDEIVGIIVEPIQSAGGHRTASPLFYQNLSRLAHEFDVYLGFDEVQTAGGQCGSFFLVDSFGLPFPPQGIATGKKLANGVVYMLEPMKDLGILDSTWGGSLTDMVRFVQEMTIVEDEKLLESVAEKSGILRRGLEEISGELPGRIHNIRGAGLYQGFSLYSPASLKKLVKTALRDEKLLLLESGTDAIRFRPVLDVTVAEIHLMLDMLRRCLARLQPSQ
ncbi:aminotransferase class III-fold pyridoxal phosphate-dependent enzyme [bacterium]|nr:aminotransferase class III-fold pyridoxal phosphate-dependent enzyme [bacterium]